MLAKEPSAKQSKERKLDLPRMTLVAAGTNNLSTSVKIFVLWRSRRINIGKGVLKDIIYENMYLDCVIEQHKIVIYSVSSFPENVFYRKRLTSQSSINNSVHETSDDESPVFICLSDKNSY